MANPLEIGSTSPEAPLQDAPNALQQGGPPQAPQGMPAPPSHEQTVAALRHFHAIHDEVKILLDNPALGKSDVKPQIIDGVTKLVAERIISPAQAVMQLSEVPQDPLQQRKWLQQMMQQTAQAANAVLDHHAAGHEGSLDWAQESQTQHPSPDSHMDMMAAMGAQYGRK
jgi:hypothetical protein